MNFAYGADGNRVLQDVSATGAQTSTRTTYVGLGSTGKSLYERTSDGNTTQHVQFIYAGGVHGGNALAFRTVTEGSSGAEAVRRDEYYHYDHPARSQPSATPMARYQEGDPTCPQEAGLLGYTPWGARRNPDGTSADSTTFAGPAGGHRAFTGHEAIPEIDLINMNGRVYDPELARFLSPDPHVQFSADLQSYNRYSYVSDNPLKYADPTGYFSLNDGLFLGAEIVGTVIGAVACPATGGVGLRLLVGLWITGAGAAADMAANGASWKQIAIASAASLAGGYLGGALGNAIAQGSGLMGAIVGGAVGGAAGSAMSSLLTNQHLSTANILQGAAMGAAMGAFQYELCSISLEGRRERGLPGGRREWRAEARRETDRACHGVCKVDQSGGYTVYVRRFADDDSFGLGFEGDDRGATTEVGPTVTSRVSGSFTIDSEGNAVIADVHSDPSQWIVGGSATGTPSATLIQTKDGVIFSTAGGNGVFHGAAPDIDTQLDLTISATPSGVQMSGTLRGDMFPSAEIFVVSPSGQATMLTTYSTPVNSSIGPFLFLFGRGEITLGTFSTPVSR